MKNEAKAANGGALSIDQAVAKLGDLSKKSAETYGSLAGMQKNLYRSIMYTSLAIYSVFPILIHSSC